MKYPFSILLAVVALLSSCVDYDYKNDVADGESAILQIGAVTFTPSNNNPTLGEAEYVIKRARLYAFDGDVLDNMVYKDNITANNLGSLLMDIKVKQTATKTLYLIINEPEDTEMHSRLALINNPAAFETLEYEMANYFNQSTQRAFNSNTTNFEKDKFCLPMFGKMENLNTITTSSSPIDVEMAATRSLARVDVMVQKGSDVNPDVKIDSQTKISISNTRIRGYIAGEKTPPADALTSPANAATGTATALNVPTKATDNSNAKLAFSFYTPERDCSTDSSKLKFKLSNVYFGGKRMDFDITIGGQGNALTKIERNKVHKIYCTFTPKTTDVQIQIINWSDVNISGDIQGSEFAISHSLVVMDWLNLGRRYDTSISFSSSDNVSFSSGDYYTKDNDGNYTKLSALPTWLNVTMPALPAKTGNIVLRYSITNGDHSDVYIKLKSGKISKYIQVVYDNGFLPASLLKSASTAWTTNTPYTGIYIAKRHNKLPSEEAENAELLSTWYGTTNSGVGSVTMNSSHGTGLSNTDDILSKMSIQNAFAAFTCRNMGGRWYLPSYKELITTFNLKAYLGNSYNMEEDWFWSSSKYSSSNVYKVSSANGSYGSAAISDSYAIRCIKNLGITLETASLTADYANWGNSFTKKIKFSSGDKLYIKSIDNTGSYKDWIRDVKITGTTDGTIDITYAPTTGSNGSHYTVYITVACSDGERTISVSYDNGVIPRYVLTSAGWSSNIPNVGLQVAKTGNRFPYQSAGSDYTMWNAHNKGTCSGAEYNYLGSGMRNTIAIINQFGSGYGGKYIAPYSCHGLMNSNWYLPSIYELQLVYNNRRYLGYSYNTFLGQDYWSSTHEGKQAWVVQMGNGGGITWKAKTEYHYFRCVSSL